MINARRSRLWLGLLLFGASSLGQSWGVEKPAKPASMLGKVIDQPERYSGLWETPIGPEKAVGIWLLLQTRIDGAATSLNHVTQYEQGFFVAVFKRDGDRLDLDHGSFPDEPDGGLDWDGRHIRARRDWRSNDASTLELDLTYDPGQETWSGFLRIGMDARVVTLHRFAKKSLKGQSDLVGTWASTEKGSHGCFYVAQLPDGKLAGWSDNLQTPGSFRYANGLKPPTSSFERYGDLLTVVALGKHSYSFQFGAYGGICCTSTLIAKVTDDSLVGDEQPGPNQEARRSIWKRMDDGSCRE